MAAAQDDGSTTCSITLKENIAVGRVVRVEAPAGAVLDTYVHRQDGRGVNAVIVELEGGDHGAGPRHRRAHRLRQARYLSRDDVPRAEVAEERAGARDITRNEGKPEAALPKIVEGGLTGWFKEHGSCSTRPS